jgi:hypothetical protein
MSGEIAQGTLECTKSVEQCITASVVAELILYGNNLSLPELHSE